MIMFSYTESRTEADWILHNVSRNVGGTAAFLKRAKAGLWVRPTGYQTVCEIHGRCYRYFEVILEGEGAFLVRPSVLGRAAFNECVISEVQIERKYVELNGAYRAVYGGVIKYERRY